MLECEGLVKRYGAKRAVDGVDLRVPRGCVFGLLGPNGAGKSTLLKMITGLIWPDEGAARIGGVDVQEDRKRALRRVGAVIEWPALYPYLSARENIRAICGERSQAFDARINEFARLVGMERWLEKKVGTFSTGMKQRIGIVLACLPDSEFIILDEPANGLDPNGMMELRDIIRHLNRERGATVLVSSHLLGEIEQVCDEVAILHAGTVAASGPLSVVIGEAGALAVVAEPAEAAERELRALGLAFRKIAVAEFRVEAGEEQAAHINRRLVEAGCAVRRLAYERPRLEDAFQRITGGAADVE